MRQSLTVLGSTGSIGVSTLDVLARHPERYTVFALVAQRQVERLFEQCLQFRPRYAVLAEDSAARELRQRLQQAGVATEVLSGVAAMEAVSVDPEVTTVMAAIVGAAGLRPTLAAARAGKRVLLANKETLVVAGELFMQTVREAGAVLLPIDSEHNAIFQSLPAAYAGNAQAAGVESIVLTASGGPFRTRALHTFDAITPEEACAHPNWSMGRKISVDSASMMNKGLEVIEARWLFNLAPEQIRVLIHPQSVIHSMVYYRDGSYLAQLGQPDMRVPIAHALAYPERIASGVGALDFTRLQPLSFETPDAQRFPCLALAFDALAAGGAATAVLNAANEVAVAAFLARRLPFNAISRVIAQTLARYQPAFPADVDGLLAIDTEARQLALTQVSHHGVTS